MDEQARLDYCREVMDRGFEQSQSGPQTTHFQTRLGDVPKPFRGNAIVDEFTKAIAGVKCNAKQ